MRTIVLTLPVAATLIAGTASAGPLRALDVNALPPTCRDLARYPTNAASPTPARSAHVSVANCLAEVRMNALTLAHDDASMRALGNATAPSIAMLDEIASAGDPGWRLTAMFAKADLYNGMAVRMRIASNGDATLEPEIKPWFDKATAAYGQVVAIARDNPSLAADNPVIASDVRSAQRYLSTPTR